MKYCSTFLLITILIFTSCTTQAQKVSTDVNVVGKMSNVMWKGELAGNIDLDSISNKKNLYGLGPIEFLAGEILIIDGKAYRSTVISDTVMKVEETYSLKAPFFGYANISYWTEQTLADSIQTIAQLENLLDQLMMSSTKPFFFKVAGTIEQATIHIVNVPKGAKVRSPEDAHKGQKNFDINNQIVDIVGFFSRKHQAIFTHHDTFLHMHLITEDRQKMGHLDKVFFKKGTVKLFLPEK
jgi:acetolactate decarboxylase